MDIENLGGNLKKNNNNLTNNFSSSYLPYEVENNYKEFEGRPIIMLSSKEKINELRSIISEQENKIHFLNLVSQKFINMMNHEGKIDLNKLMKQIENSKELYSKIILLQNENKKLKLELNEQKNYINNINMNKSLNNNNNKNKNLEKFINKPIENIKDLKNIESNLNTNFLKNKINFNNKNIKNFNNYNVSSSIGKKHLIPIKCCPICHCICNNYCNNCGCYKNVENNNFNTNNCDFKLKENNILQYPYLNYDYSRFEYPKEILKDKSYERAYEMKESYEHFK